MSECRSRFLGELSFFFFSVDYFSFICRPVITLPDDNIEEQLICMIHILRISKLTYDVNNNYDICFNYERCFTWCMLCILCETCHNILAVSSKYFASQCHAGLVIFGNIRWTPSFIDKKKYCEQLDLLLDNQSCKALVDRMLPACLSTAQMIWHIIHYLHHIRLLWKKCATHK